MPPEGRLPSQMGARTALCPKQRHIAKPKPGASQESGMSSTEMGEASLHKHVAIINQAESTSHYSVSNFLQPRISFQKVLPVLEPDGPSPPFLT
jgi:hypothetical protein